LDVTSAAECPAAIGQARGASIAAKVTLVHDDAVADDHELTGCAEQTTGCRHGGGARRVIKRDERGGGVLADAAWPRPRLGVTGVIAGPGCQRVIRWGRPEA